MTTGALSSDGPYVTAGAVTPRVAPGWGERADVVDLAVVPDRPPRAARSMASWKVLALADVTASLAVVAVAAVAAGRIAGPAVRSAGQDLAFIGAVWGSLLVALAAKRLYAQARRHLTSVTTSSLAPLLEAVVTAMLVVLAADSLAGPAVRRALPPAAVLVAFAACLALVPAVRSLAVTAHVRRGRVNTRVLVLGTGTVASDLAARLQRSAQVELVGFVDDDPVDGVAVAGVVGSPATVAGIDGRPARPGPMVLGGLGDLVDLVEQHDVNRVVVAFSRGSVDEATAQLRRLDHRVAIDVVPRFFELTGWDATLGDVNGMPVINLHDGPAHGAARAAKRALDIIVAATGLLVCAPVLAVLALAVRLTSPGPALFTQTRLGAGRQRFRIIKLRTMYVAEEPDGAPEIVGAPGAQSRRPGTLDESRVTPLGRFLRRSGLDEIPQLFNVLAGHMSLVGPRPFIPAECRELPEWSDARFDVRPGMTGLWQVCGQHYLRFEELCRLDVLYVTRWSLGADLRILARTPRRLLHGGGGDGSGVD